MGVEETIIEFYKEEAKRTWLEEGREAGLQKGPQEGLEEGRLGTLRTTATNSLREVLPIELVSRVTGLSEEEVRGIAKRLGQLN